MWLISLTAVVAIFSGWMGWIDGSGALDILMATLALIGLWVTLWLPWDLYFAARELAIDQRESEARGIKIDEGDRNLAKKVAPRLLTCAIGLHVLGAGCVALVTYFTQGRIGYLFAGFYIVSMVLRPMGAVYRHLRKRIAELRERARYPREDVQGLKMRVEHAEEILRRIDNVDLPSLTEVDERLESDGLKRDEDARLRERRYEEKVNRVLVELERSMAKLTEDRELLQGIRAFVRVVRQS